MLSLNQYGRLLSFSILLLTLLLLSACSKRFVSNTPDSPTDEYHEFVAVGYAVIAAQKGDSDNIKMLNAIKTSKLDAYKELAEQVYGVMLTSENTIKLNQLQDEVLEVKVTGLVRGAKVLRSYHEGDLYITELGLKMKVLPNTDYADFSTTDGVIHVQPPTYY